MIKANDVNLRDYNTFRINAVARELFTPESEEELCNLIQDLTKRKEVFYLLGNGSNILFLDEKIIDKKIIYLGKVNTTLRMNDDSIIEVGCSVRLQKLVNFINLQNMGGIEYLYSIPAFTGGAVAMNAGRGRKYNQAISDYLIKVRVFDGEKIFEMNRENCKFSYRDSFFKHNNHIVLAAFFDFPVQDKEIGERMLKERIEYCRRFQDNEKPNAGTVFRKANKYIMKILMGKKCGGAMFSKKTPNWIANINEAKSKDILNLIHKAENLHKLLFQKTELEIKIID